MTIQFRKQYQVDFLGKATSLHDLHTHFPNACLLKQTHSDILVPADASTPHGDGHWSAKAAQPLVIQTADCMPVMMFLPKDERIVAIHAGWRGVENRIVTKSLNALGVQAGDSIDVIIGPHIQQASFEVDPDVAVSILKAHGHSLDSPYSEKRGDKYHILLSALIIDEIKALGLRIEHLHISDIDTKVHPEYYSYRDGDRGGRNYSVINKKSAL